MNKRLVSHCKVEDLTGNKTYAVGTEIPNDFKPLAGKNSHGCVSRGRDKPCKLGRLKAIKVLLVLNIPHVFVSTKTGAWGPADTAGNAG